MPTNREPRRWCRNEPALPEPLACFLTWTTYGTWLPGDERGWVEYKHGLKLPDPIRKREAEARMSEDACVLDPDQRELVERTIADHCRYRNWELFAVNCRSNHVHVVVAANCHAGDVRNQLKAWCTRRLREREATHQLPPAQVPTREKWWSERGCALYINTELALEAVVQYVREAQDAPRFEHEGIGLSPERHRGEE